jgi:probable HAF family extracellular repeat protein
VAVSDDGAVAVGRSYVGNLPQAFRWTPAEGMVGLGYLPGAPFEYSYAADVSADGAVVVGASASEDADAPGYEAFIWTEETGMVGLGFPDNLLEGDNQSHALCVSADGAVVAGTGGQFKVVFRWTAAEGMVNLGDLPGNKTRGAAFGMSADGSLIVGRGSTNQTNEALLWTEETGLVGLGVLPEGEHSEAYAVSAEGEVLVGVGDTVAVAKQAFRWTAAEGFVALADVPYSVAKDVSGDGAVIVGYARTGAKDGAAIWTEATGLRLLHEVLMLDLGLDPAGWTLSDAQGISTDGRFVVGDGVNAEGEIEPWLLYLGDPVPCLGDLSGDSVRDDDDLALLLASYGGGADGDLDGDGDTDLSDLALMLRVYQRPCLTW